VGKAQACPPIHTVLVMVGTLSPCPPHVLTPLATDYSRSLMAPPERERTRRLSKAATR